MYITYHTLAHRLAPRPCDSDIYTWRDSFHLCNSRIPMSWDVTEDPDVRLGFCLITPFFLSVLRGMVLHSIFFQTVWQTQRSASVSHIVLGSSYRFQYLQTFFSRCWIHFFSAVEGRFRQKSPIPASDRALPNTWRNDSLSDRSQLSGRWP